MMGPVSAETTGSGSDAAPGFPGLETLGPLGLTLRPERPDDLETLQRLYISMRWDELAPLTDWSDEQKIGFLTQQFGAQRAHYARAYAEAVFLIVEHTGQAVGRIVVHRSTREIRVVDIGFFPEHRNHGYGTALLHALFTEGDANNQSVSVHVEVFNPARTLYTRLGFEPREEHGPYLLMVRPPLPQLAP